MKSNTKKLLLIIISILFILSLIVLLIPKMLFTNYQGLPVTGPYEIRHTSAILVDNNRLETFESDGSCREIPVHFYYPDTDSIDNTFPLVIFSHGAFGYYESNTSTYMELASHGYVVVSLDHPYHSFFTTDTSGKTITVNPSFMQEVMKINQDDISEEEIITLSHKWLKLRIDDINFVLDSIIETKNVTNNILNECWFISNDNLSTEIKNIIKITDTQTIGLMGHSLGGAASVTLGRIRNDIDAVIDLDGTMLGEELGYSNGTYQFFKEIYPTPILLVSNEEHHNQAIAVGDNYVNNVILDNAPNSSYTYFKGSGHMNFTDLPLFSPVLASILGTGTIDSTTCITTMNSIVLNFYDYYLKDKGVLTLNESY